MEGAAAPGYATAMTSYNWRLTFNDREAVALDAAVDAYMKHCAERIAAGAGAPYLAHLDVLAELRPRMFEKAVLAGVHRPPGDGGA